MKKLFILSLAVLAISGTAFAQKPFQIGPGPAQDINQGGSCPSGGDVILDNLPNQSNGIFSDSVCNFCGGGAQVLAQPFTIPDDTIIDEIVIYGGFFPGNGPPASQMFRVLIHSDTAGLPGATLSDETVAPTSSTPTGVVLFNVDEYEVVLNITPVGLTVGTTYWLEIYDDVINPDDWFWEVGDLDPGQPAGSGFAFEAPGVTWTSDPANSFATTICGMVVPVDLQSFDVE